MQVFCNCEERSKLFDDVLDALLGVSKETAIKLLYGSSCTLFENSPLFLDIMDESGDDFFTGTSLSELDEGFDRAAREGYAGKDEPNVCVESEIQIGYGLYSGGAFVEIASPLLRRINQDTENKIEEGILSDKFVEEFNMEILNYLDKYGDFRQIKRFEHGEDMPNIVQAVVDKFKRTSKLDVSSYDSAFTVGIEVTSAIQHTLRFGKPVEFVHPVVKFTISATELRIKDLAQFAELYAMKPEYYLNKKN